MKSVGIIGDSIAHGYYDEEKTGWVARLGELMLSAHNDIYMFNNLSQSGDNIADAVGRTNCEILSRHFDLIIINIGINDLRRRKDSDMQLDLSEGVRTMYWNKLLDMVQTTNAKIVVTDLIPVVEQRYTSQATLIRRNSDVVRYNEIIKDICTQRKINFFARYQNWIKRDLMSLYQDATHPNAKGHQILAEEVYDYLQAHDLL